MGCDWYGFDTATGYGIAVKWKDVAEVYAAESKTEDPNLSVLIEWLRSKVSEQHVDMLVYDVCHRVAFFTLRGLCCTERSVNVPGPYEIERDETELVYLQPLSNIPAISSDDERLEQIARQFTPADKKLGFPPGWWAVIYDSYNIDLLTLNDASSKKATTKSGPSEAKKLKETESGVPKEDKCTFLVGPEKTEIVWDRIILGESSPTLSKILYGSGEIKTDPSNPIVWLDFNPESTKLLFESLPLPPKGSLRGKQRKKNSGVVSDQVFEGCKVLADYLGIEFHSLSIQSDRFAEQESLEKYENCDVED